jgi:hypothetical protein
MMNLYYRLLNYKDDSTDNLPLCPPYPPIILITNHFLLLLVTSLFSGLIIRRNVEPVPTTADDSMKGLTEYELLRESKIKVSTVMEGE